LKGGFLQASVAIEPNECRNRQLTTNNLRHCGRHRLSRASAHSPPGAIDVPGMLRADAPCLRSEDSAAQQRRTRARAICSILGRQRSRTPAEAATAAAAAAAASLLIQAAVQRRRLASCTRFVYCGTENDRWIP